MSKYKLSTQARDDLKEIYQYTQLNFGINQAKKYLSKITDVLNALSDKILTGRDASLFAHGLRKIEVGSHLVFYLNKENVIIVIRVLHNSMDISKHF